MANDLQSIPHVPGYCDTCGQPTLIRGADGTVSCSYVDCPSRLWPAPGVLRRVARTVRCLAADFRAVLDAALDRFNERVAVADRASRTRRSDAYGQALRALYHDRSIPIPDDRRDDALAAFEQLINQGIDVPTAYAMVTGEDWLPGEQ